VVGVFLYLTLLYMIVWGMSSTFQTIFFEKNLKQSNAERFSAFGMGIPHSGRGALARSARAGRSFRGGLPGASGGLLWA
jgi:hypothetical protein